MSSSEIVSGDGEVASSSLLPEMLERVSGLRVADVRAAWKRGNCYRAPTMLTDVFQSRKRCTFSGTAQLCGVFVSISDLAS